MSSSEANYIAPPNRSRHIALFIVSASAVRVTSRFGKSGRYYINLHHTINFAGLSNLMSRINNLYLLWWCFLPDKDVDSTCAAPPTTRDNPAPEASFAVPIMSHTIASSTLAYIAVTEKTGQSIHHVLGRRSITSIINLQSVCVGVFYHVMLCFDTLSCLVLGVGPCPYIPWWIDIITKSINDPIEQPVNQSVYIWVDYI